MKKNGFTLIELLAVIVILAIILAIAIPSISGVVRSAARGAFESDAKMVLKAIDYKKLEIESFDPTTVNQGSVADLLGLSAENYSSVSVKIEDNIPIINIVGAGKWDGFIACGTYQNMKVAESASECGDDVIPPVITVLGDNPVSIFVGDTYSDAGSTATDAVDGNVTNNVVVTGLVNPNAPGTYTITYSVTDVAGNQAITTRTINVIDNIAPVITFNPTGNTIYAKSRSVVINVSDVGVIDNNSLKYQWTTSTTQPLTDTFTTTFTNGQSITTPVAVSGTYYLWAIAKDTANNQIISSSNAFNLDNVKPLITRNGSATVTVSKGAVYSDAGATATDNIDASVVVNASGTVNVNVIGTYTITYNATDTALNAATAVTRTVNVVDISAPVITVLGSNPVTINVGAVYTDAGATALDDVNGNLTSSIIKTGTVNPSIAGTYTITYTVSDTALNTAVATRTVNVVVPSTAESCFTFTPANGTITDYNPSCGTTVVIPSTIGGINVTILGYQAFYNNALVSATIPGSVISIGYDAFARNSLSSLTIQSGVASITSGAFSSNQLTSLTIPSSVTFIGGGAFNDNQLPDAQAFIYARGAGGSSDTTNLVSYGGSKRASVVIPSNVITVGDEAFESVSLTSVTIPTSVRTIGQNAFHNNLLTGISIPSTVTSMGDGAFWDNAITSVTIPNGITAIGQSLFSSNSLTSIVIPSGVTSIGNVAFAYNALTNVTIPSSVTSIGAGAFNNNQLPDAKAFIYQGGISDTAKLISYGGAKKTGVVIPSTVTSIGYNTFGKQGLVSVTIPNSVINIWDSSFTDNNLTSIVIPHSVISIGYMAFAFNYIPQGSATIDSSSASVTIGSYAFDYNVNRNTTITPVFLR